jgi:hypothetical protein
MSKDDDEDQLEIQDVESDEEAKSPKGNELGLAKHRHGWFARVFRTGDVMDEKKLLSFKKVCSFACFSLFPLWLGCE